VLAIKNLILKHLTLTKESADTLANNLQDAGYVESKKQQYMRYFKSHGDSTYISRSLNIIRCVKNTKGHALVIYDRGQARI
jgi:hypothetical protein